MSLHKGLNLVGSQFVEIGQTTKDIQEFFDPESNTLPGYGDAFESATKLLVWGGTGYTTYEWSADGEGTAIGDATQDAKWLTQGGAAVAVDSAPAGKAFWVSTTADSTVVVSGEVKDGTEETAAVSGLTLLCNPFPVAMDIQNIVPDSSVPGYGDGFESATKLLVWGGTGYTTYEWSAAGEGTAIGDPSQDSKWLTQGGAAVGVATIAVGEGFWINTSGSGNVTFSK